MDETSLSLLDRLRAPSDVSAWDRLVSLYGPLLRHWLRRYSLQPSDVDDLVQEVLLTVANQVGEFDHNGRVGAFRTWLRTILVHRLRNFFRARQRRPRVGGDSDWQNQLRELEDPNSRLSAIWDRHHDEYIARQLLASVEHEFAPKTWQAFCRTALVGQRPDRVAADLEISLNAVFIAKSRVLRRLRQQATGLLDTTGSFFKNR